MDRHVLHRIAIDRDLARIGPHQPDNHVKRGGLACTVRAQQTYNLATFNAE